VWLETTLIIALSHVSVVAFSLQIARGYFIRLISKFSLRLGADFSWLIYTLTRDAFLILAFIIGLLVFLPGTFLDYPMAVPFMPVAVVFFGAALVTKLLLATDDTRNGFRLVTLLIFGGMVLWIFGTILVTESPLQLSMLPPGVSASGGIWYVLVQSFSSQTNLSLAMSSFELCLAVLSGFGILALVHSLIHWNPSPGKSSIQRVKYVDAISPSPQVVSNLYEGSLREEVDSFPKSGRIPNGVLDTHEFGVEKGNRPSYIG